MDNQDNKLIKPPDPKESPSGTAISKTGGGVKITGKSRLHSALVSSGPAPKDPEAAFKAAAAELNKSQIDKHDDPNTAEHRIAIMADCSGSMGSRDNSRFEKIELLRQALGSFIDQINPDNTSVAIYTFPFYEHGWEDDNDNITTSTYQSHGVHHKLSRDKNLLKLMVNGLKDGGGTPMSSAMNKVITDIPLSRGIIISDGEADSAPAALEEAHKFAKSETKIDCVHIGTSASGENLLAQIAKITGGLYLKFDNVDNFAKAFSFLTPEGRAKLALAAGPQATLAEKAEVARQLGAKEIK